MKLRPLQDLAEENFPFVCEPVHARFWLNNAFRDYVRIEDFGEHLKNCEREACELEGDPDHWNGRLLGYERLLAYITRGSLVLVMEPGDFPLHPMDRAFVQKADEHWEPDPDNIWEPGIREHLAYRAEHMHHEHQERERYAANHPPAREPEYLPATGPRYSRPTLGPHAGQIPLMQDISSKAVTSENRPELERIANDPGVRAEINKSWNNSNPHGPGASKKEQGFWVVKDSKTGALTVQQFPSNGTRDSLMPGPVPNGAVAFFHTHPNTAAEGYTSGPSPADVRFANAKGVPGIIQSHDGMYYFGPKLP